MNATANEEEFLDLRQLIDKLWARRWWLILSTALFTSAAVAYAISSERIYRATTVLAPGGTGGQRNATGGVLGQLGGLASLAGVNVGPNGADTEEALAVLRSRQFTERFFADEKLLPKFFPEAWDGRTQAWKNGKGAPSVSRAFTMFDRDVRHIVQNRKTGLVSLEIEWTDRAEAARWANELVRRLNQEMRTRAISEANISIEYLEKELASTSVVEMRQAINRLVEGQVKQRMLANVNQEYAFRVIDQATVPEADEAIKPRRARIVLVGMLLGFFLGSTVIVFVDYLRRGRVKAA